MNQRLAIVTGGSRGIGRAIAARLLAEGHDVLLVARDESELERACTELGTGLTGDGRVSMVCADLADPDQVQRLAHRWAEAEFLVLNAGLARSAPLGNTTLADWDAHFALNARSLFLCLRSALPAMRQRGFGRVVVVASTAAKVGAPYTSAYTASKHAALGLVRAAASECSGTCVTVNAVCPTFVRSEMTERSIRNLVVKTGRSEEEARRALERASPLGRFVEPDEVAHAVAFLCSELAAPIHGQAIVLDGGGVQS